MMQNAFDWQDEISRLIRYAPIVALLIVLLWAGNRGYWYFGRNTRAVMRQVEIERDQWRELALAMLAKNGIALPKTVTPESIAQILNGRNHG